MYETTTPTPNECTGDCECAEAGLGEGEEEPYPPYPEEECSDCAGDAEQEDILGGGDGEDMQLPEDKEFFKGTADEWQSIFGPTNHEELEMAIKAEPQEE